MTSPKHGASARDVAARALVRVWQQDAFASAALDAELARTGLDARDAALSTELCYGVLRVESALLEEIAKASQRFKAPSGLVRAHLLAGAYSICFLDRVPPFAAVSEAVSAVRSVAGPKVSGFVNAVLRRLAERVEKKGRPKLADAVVATCPAWLREAIGRAVGPDQVVAHLTEGASPPPLGLCVSRAEERDAIIAQIGHEASRAHVEAGAVSPRAILVRGAGDLRNLTGYGERMISQEEGAQMVALSLGARRGDRVLDACAGHGNKTWLLRREVGAEGALCAADLYPQKLRQIEDDPGGPGVSPVRTLSVDWASGPGEVPVDFDRALLDVPCSGSGTLRRRPEICRKRTKDDVTRLAALQRTILRGAAQCVHNGGRLVYAVCSVLREEAEDVVEAVISEGASNTAKLVPAPFDSPLVERLFGSVTSLRLLPHVHGTDGYFLASFEVIRSS